jgi:chemotaxis protein CheX
MQAYIINAFLTSAFSVLETMLGKAPQRGDLGLQSVPQTNHQVNVVCGVSGHIVGQVIYGMSMATANRIASAMSGQQIKMFDQFAASAVAELGNMISGNALLKLSEEGFICDITPPTLVKGSKVEVSTLNIPAISIPLVTDHGEVSITVGYQPGSK